MRRRVEVQVLDGAHGQGVEGLEQMGQVLEVQEGSGGLGRSIGLDLQRHLAQKKGL